MFLSATRTLASTAARCLIGANSIWIASCRAIGEGRPLGRTWCVLQSPAIRARATAVHGNLANGCRRLTVHGANNFEIIVKAAANSDHSNDDQRDLALQNCCVKNIKLAQKSSRNGTPASEIMPISIANARNGERLARP